MRKLLLFRLVALALLAPGMTWGQGSRLDNISLGPRGPVPATVAVCNQPSNTSLQPCSPLATLYPDSTLQNYTIAPTGAARSNGTVTITTTAANSIPVGQIVTISGVNDPTFNGTFPVQSTGGGQFTYAQAGANATSGNGTVSAPNPFQTDAFGNYHFYAAVGKYTVQLYGPQLSSPFVQTDQILPGTTAGTVTSVALTAPPEFSVSGSPVTGSGTLAIAKTNQSANQVYAGPSSGAAAAPSFRALVGADIPAIKLFDVLAGRWNMGSSQRRRNGVYLDLGAAGHNAKFNARLPGE